MRASQKAFQMLVSQMKEVTGCSWIQWHLQHLHTDESCLLFPKLGSCLAVAVDVVLSVSNTFLWITFGYLDLPWVQNYSCLWNVPLAWSGIAYLILIAWITEARGRGKGISHLMLGGDMEEVTKNPLDSNSCLRPNKTHHCCKPRLGREQRQSTKIQGCMLTLLIVYHFVVLVDCQSAVWISHSLGFLGKS